MSDNQQWFTQRQKELIGLIASILKRQYRSLYEQMLGGNKNPFLAKLAAQVGIAEDVFISEIIAYEVMNILKDAKIENDYMEELAAGLH